MYKIVSRCNATSGVSYVYPVLKCVIIVLMCVVLPACEVALKATTTLHIYDRVAQAPAANVPVEVLDPTMNMLKPGVVKGMTNNQGVFEFRFPDIVLVEIRVGPGRGEIYLVTKGERQMAGPILGVGDARYDVYLQPGKWDK